jgi:hypothetical protein
VGRSQYNPFESEGIYLHNLLCLPTALRTSLLSSCLFSVILVLYAQGSADAASFRL